jgi:predicted Zn-dependent peptidase
MTDRTAFEKTTLPNGVRVVTETIPSMRSVAVGVWVSTGSRDEAAAQAGICHFIEHMVFKGTTSRRMHQIAQRLESVGGYLNAFTGKEDTCYYARVLDEHLDRAIETILDLIIAPTFPPKELEKEKDVVVEEMKMYEDTPDDYIFDLFEAEIYRGHPMGVPVIGLEQTVRSFTREGLFDYLQRHYTPDRIVLAAAGKLDHRKVVRAAEKAFARMSRPQGPRSRLPVNGYRAGEKVFEKPIQQAHLVVGLRTYDVYHPRRVALNVYNTVLGGGMSSRINQNIREKYGYCYSIYSFVNQQSDCGDFGVYMGTDPGKVGPARRLILRELERLAQHPLSPRTLAQAKSQVKGSMMLGLESMNGRMMRLGKQEIYYERYQSLDEVCVEVEAVTAEDVLAVARDLYQPDQFSTVVLMPKAGA